MTQRTPLPRRRAFSLIEVLIALMITATLLTATLTALDTSFRSYKVTTEQASTNVIARMVMHRMMTMIRTGTEFGPYPEDPLDITQNPLESNAIEFQTAYDPATDRGTIVRLERREQADPARGPYELWYRELRFEAGVLLSQEQRPLLSGISELRFVLEYDVGPRLRRATIDMTVKPNDFQGASFGSDLEAPPIRLVSSVSPRRLDAR